MDIRAMRAEADELRGTINELIGKAGELTDSEVGDLEAAETRLLEVNKEVTKAEIIERATKAIDTPTFTRRGSAQVETTGAVDSYEQCRRNMVAAARGETRAYNTSDDSSLIPTDLQDELIRRLPALSAVRSAATVRVFSQDAEIPSILSRISGGGVIAENGAFTTGEGTYTKIAVNNYKSAIRTQITIEMMADNRAGAGGLVADTLNQHMEHHAEIWDELYLSEEAVSARTAPAGLCAAAADVNTGSNSSINDVDAAGVTTAAGVDIDNLIDTMNALPGRYRTGPKSWIMSPAVHAAIVGSTDTNSRLVFLPQATGTVQENPLSVGTILGYPVYLSDFMPSPANDKVAAILLDRRSYMVADRAQMQSQIDPYTYGGTGLVELRTWMRSDGLWTLPEASARLIFAT